MAWMCENNLAEFNNSVEKKNIKKLTSRTGISKAKYYKSLKQVHSLFVKYVVWETRNSKSQV